MEIIKNQQPLPNATAVLLLGILSIVISCLGVGLILGIIGLVISRKDKQLNEMNPAAWSGYGNLNAGRIMCIIGLCLSGLMIMYFIIWGLFIGAIGGAATGFGNIF